MFHTLWKPYIKYFICESSIDYSSPNSQFFSLFSVQSSQPFYDRRSTSDKCHILTISVNTSSIYHIRICFNAIGNFERLIFNILSQCTFLLYILNYNLLIWSDSFSKRETIIKLHYLLRIFLIDQFCISLIRCHRLQNHL